jgi:cytochrome b
LHLFHFIITSAYTWDIPSNLFYWLTMLAHAGACVVWAEALSIRREINTGWTSGWEDSEAEHGHQEQASLLANSAGPSMNRTSNKPTTHVLFEEDDVDDEDDTQTGKRKGANGHTHPSIEEIEMKNMD